MGSLASYSLLLGSGYCSYKSAADCAPTIWDGLTTLAATGGKALGHAFRSHLPVPSWRPASTINEPLERIRNMTQVASGSNVTALPTGDMNQVVTTVPVQPQFGSTQRTSSVPAPSRMISTSPGLTHGRASSVPAYPTNWTLGHKSSSQLGGLNHARGHRSARSAY